MHYLHLQPLISPPIVSYLSLIFILSYNHLSRSFSDYEWLTCSLLRWSLLCLYLLGISWHFTLTYFLYWASGPLLHLDFPPITWDASSQWSLFAWSLSLLVVNPDAKPLVFSGDFHGFKYYLWVNDPYIFIFNQDLLNNLQTPISIGCLITLLQVYYVSQVSMT